MCHHFLAAAERDRGPARRLRPAHLQLLADRVRSRRQLGESVLAIDVGQRAVRDRVAHAVGAHQYDRPPLQPRLGAVLAVAVEVVELVAVNRGLQEVAEVDFRHCPVWQYGDQMEATEGVAGCRERVRPAALADFPHLPLARRDPDDRIRSPNAGRRRRFRGVIEHAVVVVVHVHRPPRQSRFVGIRHSVPVEVVELGAAERRLQDQEIPKGQIVGQDLDLTGQ